MAKLSNSGVALKSANPVVRENMLEKVFMLDTTDTPFTNAAGITKDTTGDRIIKWNTNTLGAVNGDVAVEPAEDTKPTASQVVKQFQNSMQIFREAFTVDGAKATINNGQPGTYNYELAQRIKLMKLNIEQRALSNKGSILMADGTGGLMAGLGAQFKVNANHATGGSGTDGSTPGYNNGTGVFGNAVVAAAGKQRVLTEALLKEAFREIFDKVGNKTTLQVFANGVNIEKISGFTGRSDNRVELKRGEVSQFVDVYISPFGDMVRIIPATYAPVTDTYIVNTDEVMIKAKRTAEETKDAGTIADGVHGVVRSEVTLITGDDKTHAKIADLKE